MKKVISFILASLVLFSILSVTVSAAGDIISAATSISLDKSYSGSITSSSKINSYKFILNNSGRVNLELSVGIKYAYFYIYDANADVPVWQTGGIEWNSTTELIVLDRNIDLTSGTYYFCVKQGLSYTGSYNFKLNFSSAGESFKEPQDGNNNKTETADSINLGTRYYGQIAANDEKDYYKFTVSSSNDVTLDVSASIKYSYYYIYDSSVKEIWKSGGMTWNYTTELLSLNKTITLSAGTYYFCVEKGNSNTGNYNFKITSATTPDPKPANINLSLSRKTVDLRKGETAEIVCSYTGNYHNVTIYYSIGDKETVACKWGGWKNHINTLAIQALAEGETTVTVGLKDSDTGEVYDYEVINVKVIELTTTPDNNSGSNNSGTGFFLLDLLIFIFKMILTFFGF